MKIFKILFSMSFMAVSLIAYAIAMAVATFIENDYGAPVARQMIYNAWWFELIQAILAVNFIGNIFKYKLFKKGKISILIFHFAFVIILIGAAVTRYVGFEGTMSIREGDSSNKFLSAKSYLQISSSKNENSLLLDKEVFVSPSLQSNSSTSFSEDGTTYDIELKRVIPKAEKTFVEDENGHAYLEIIFSSDFGMINYYIEDQSVITFQEQLFGLNYPMADSSVFFSIEDNRLFAKLPYDLQVVSMMGNKDTTILPSGEKHELKIRQLYNFGNIKFVIKEFAEKAKLSYKTGNLKEGIRYNVLEFVIKTNDEIKEIFVPAVVNEKGENVSFRINQNNFFISYGSKEIELPFELKLRDFQLDRYPGSQNPSSYASEVTLIDQKKNIDMNYRIFMNNVLEHNGYRFYQSSFDRDEKGTILTVNHDKAGTIITYFGYFLLALGMFWSIFNKNSYFAELSKRTSEIRKKRIASLLILSFTLFGQQIIAQKDDKPINFNKEHAQLFGTILTQGEDGRLKPFNTISSELLRKVSRKEKFNGLTPNQVILGMMFDPMHWQNVEMIKISHPELKKMLNIEGKYASFNQLRDVKRGFNLEEYYNKAFSKKTAQRDKFDKEILAVTERFMLSQQVYAGQFLKLFPVPGDVHHKWLTLTKLKVIKDSTERNYVASIFSDYYNAIVEAQNTNDWSKADEAVNSIKEFQKKYAKEILPSDTKIKMEIYYVNADIFKGIFRYYGIVGFILLIVLFIGILNPRIKVKIPIIIAAIMLALIFLYHTFGLGLRWYIAGRAPWSNGYESMIYVGWATMLAGFIFMKRSSIALAATALLTSITLMVAHLSWMDPEITNLVPVLQSYWLTFHVSVITASYGFLGLGALMGFLALVLMIFKTNKNVSRLELTLSEITHVNHMTLIIGLYLLTIGTFLGAIWANESWGRYWGWDPKETWALITIIVYSFVVHMRFIPSLNNKYAFNLGSLIAVSSVLMTYFGVNYYLAGLHSYAKGDPVPVPDFVYYTIAVIVLVAVFSNIRNRVKPVDQAE